MGAVGCVAGVFLLLGLACVLLPEQMAELGVRLDWTGRERSRAILKRYARLTRWSGRVVGGILILAGLVILFASRL